MKLLKLFIALAILFTANNITVKAQTADEIMSKHEQAIGGIERWDKITTLTMKGSFSQGGMDINVSQIIAVGKAVRIDINLMGKSGFRIITTTDGWVYMPFMGAAKLDTMKPEVVMSAQKQLNIKEQQMLDYKARGVKIEYTGKDTLNNTACYKVKLTDKEGKESIAYFDCATYYLLRAETKTKIDEQEQEVSVDFGDYKKFEEGIVFPMSVTMQGVEAKFTSVVFNNPIDENTFKPIIPKVEEEKK